MDRNKKEKGDILPSSQSAHFPDYLHHFFEPSYFQSLLKPFQDLFEKTMSLPLFQLETFESEKELIVEGKLPGVKKEQIQIGLFDNVLTVSVQHRQQYEQANDQKQIVEMFASQGTCSKSFYLPPYADTTKMKASFENEKLVIVIPSRKKNIPIADSF